MRLTLADNTEIPTHAVVIATGARYRTLPLERWSDYEGAGIYFAATELEAKACATEPVTVVGGANSAGQASMYLADRGSPVDLVVRGADLAAGMSRLPRRPDHRPSTDSGAGWRPRSPALYGDASLAEVRTTTRARGRGPPRLPGVVLLDRRCNLPTEWLVGDASDKEEHVALDDDGFVFTDQQLSDDSLLSDAGGRCSAGRPLPFETSVPGVFAGG